MELRAMVDNYKTFEACERHFDGFARDGFVWAYESVFNGLGCVLDRAAKSKGGAVSMRFRPTADEKKAMIKAGAFKVCTIEHFEEVHEMLTPVYGSNKGHDFEYVMAEYFGQTWEKDTLKWWEGPDMIVNGITYQLKFERATFTTETQLIRVIEGLH